MISPRLHFVTKRVAYRLRLNEALDKNSEYCSSMEEWYVFRNLVSAGEYSDAKVYLRKHPELREKRNSIGETVLHFLAVENDIKAVQWLAENGFDPHAQNEFGQSTLFEVASLEYFPLVDWPLDNGADIMHKDQNGDDIYMYLEGMDKFKSIQYLKQKNV